MNPLANIKIKANGKTNRPDDWTQDRNIYNNVSAKVVKVEELPKREDSLRWCIKSKVEGAKGCVFHYITFNPSDKKPEGKDSTYAELSSRYIAFIARSLAESTGVTIPEEFTPAEALDIITGSVGKDVTLSQAETVRNGKRGLEVSYS